jgi:EmrB/QacA subfamily drug resistance transporter
MFVAGLGIFTAASAACALSSSIGWLIAARAVQGAGAALVMPLAMALLSEAFPREERAKALGIFSGVTGLAILGGPVVGGAIAEGVSWQWIFWLNIPIGLLTMPLVAGRIRESFGPGAAFDGFGLVLVTGAALGLVWGLVRANSAGWASLEVVVALTVGALLTLVFVAWELRAPAPMVPLSFFRSRAFAASNLACFCFTGSIYGALFFMAQFLQTAQGYGPLGAGLRLLPWTAVLFVVAPIAGALVNRVGERPLVAGGLFLQAAGMGWLALIASPDLALAQLAAPLILAGVGVSLAIPAAQAAVMGAVAPTEIGKASGTYNMLRFLGGVFGIAIGVAVFSETGGFGSAQLFSDGFSSAIGVAAALSLIGAGAGAALPSRRRTPVAPNTNITAQPVPALGADAGH